MAFVQDLKNGEAIEQEILKLIQVLFPHAYKETGKFHRKFFDLVIPKLGKQPEILIEIKADLYKSSNLCYECLGRGGKSTGIIKTSSHLWIQFRNERYLVWKTRILKRYLLDLGGFIRDSGDDKASSCWIVPEEKIIKECPPDIIVARGGKELAEFIKNQIK